MATCLCDAFFDGVAKATVEVLEHAGCEVEFPENQTCCGQPAFNCGDWPASREVMRHTARVFEGGKPVIVPSGSCAAMLFHGAPLEFEKEKISRSWKNSPIALGSLPISSSTALASRNGRAAFQPASLFTELVARAAPGSGEAALKLLRSIEGLEVIPFGEAEQCCGFGGTFP
jgi:L-lactate dehydrogenase complex protein LldE